MSAGALKEDDRVGQGPHTPGILARIRTAHGQARAIEETPGIDLELALARNCQPENLASVRHRRCLFRSLWATRHQCTEREPFFGARRQVPPGDDTGRALGLAADDDRANLRALRIREVRGQAAPAQVEFDAPAGPPQRLRDRDQVGDWHTAAADEHLCRRRFGRGRARTCSAAAMRSTPSAKPQAGTGARAPSVCARSS